MKRYLLFHGMDYYPSGGMLDLTKNSDNLEDLLSFISKLDYCEWAHIYDCEEAKIIFQTQNLSDKIFESNFQWVKSDN